MTDKLKHALFLARKNFYVFPLIPNSKMPLIKNFAELSTHDEEQIKKWWEKYPDANIGIYAGKYNGGSECLVVIDVDVKKGKKGDESLLELELQGYEFKETFTQLTPTGGRHLIYRSNKAVKLGQDSLGPGLDVRSKGGYIVGAGSSIDGKNYSCIDLNLEFVSDKVAELCGKPKEKIILDAPVIADQDLAIKRGADFLKRTEQISIQGAGGTTTAYKVCCVLKDFGLSKDNSLSLLVEYWNERCQPPWSFEELENLVDSAHKYGLDSPGVAAPEADFEEVKIEEDNKNLSPVEKLNKEYAFILLGGNAYVLRETKGPKGDYTFDYLTVQAFHQYLAPDKVAIANGKNVRETDLWLNSPKRRTYEGVCFLPGKNPARNYFNLWKGYSFEPQDPKVIPAKKAKQSLEYYLQHIKENICGNDNYLYEWVMTFLAHLVQKPYEKPLVSLVLRGAKGVGKNVFIETVGNLIKNNFVVVSNSRYLTGNFNSHLERCLLLVFDEAFWSGDKKAEGVLKDLITGDMHTIERKGKEPYQVENLTRAVILGNEDWLVPASADERRFCVLDVGSGKKQNREFFKVIKQGMSEGGYRLLLRYLLDYDISKVDISVAPLTEALISQKLSSLTPIYQFWFECLKEGSILNQGFDGGWDQKIDKEAFRKAFSDYCDSRKIHTRISMEEVISKHLKDCCPGIVVSRNREEGSRTRKRFYNFPSLETCRKNWESFINGKLDWEE